MKNKLYIDRIDAGNVLAGKLKGMNIKNGVIIAIPRGGVVIAAQVSKVLDLPLDIIIPKKIGAPLNKEVAIGAVTQDGTVILSENEYIKNTISKTEIKEIAEKEIKEINRRMLKYRGNTIYPSYAGKTVIIIDDGIATGFTTQAALISIKKMFRPQKIILAVPVAPKEVIQILEKYVDIIICPLVPEIFYAVGQFYENFNQVSDEEVIKLLHKSAKK